MNVFRTKTVQVHDIIPVLLSASVSQGSGIFDLLSNSGNEWVAHVVSRPVGHPLSSVDELRIL